jgi:hypothetical protein
MKIDTNAINPVKTLQKYITKDGYEHVWQFSRIGGINRVNISSGKDICYLRQLDQKLWTALSCPVHGLEIDEETLKLIDYDNDGRVRVPEIIEAADWISGVIKNHDEILESRKSMPLGSINDENEEGKILLASAKRILMNLGTPEKEDLTVAETSDTVRIFAGTRFNGDGIITVGSTDDESLKKRIGEIILCCGSINDRSGNPGVDSRLIENFYNSCRNYSEWMNLSEKDPKNILPAGKDTAAAYEAFMSVRDKIEDFFVRCRLADYDAESSPALNLQKSQLEVIAAHDLSVCPNEIAVFPLAKINRQKALPLKEGLNPSWEKRMQEFAQLVMSPFLPGKTQLTMTDWESVKTRFIPFAAWLESKKGAETENLGIDYVREILSRNEEAALQELIAEDMALEAEANNILKVNKLVRYYCDFYTLLKNYVNFNDFYSPGTMAAFQAGKLYIDQRCLDLCIKVSDMSRHNTLALGSGICLVYCDCVSKKKNEKMTIVAAITDGDNDNISVGRNALFYDRKGQDWDATITKILDNPISIRQAFWSPYKKFSKFIGKQIEKLAASKEAEVDAATTEGIEKTTDKVNTGLTASVKSPSEITPAQVPVAAQPPAPFDIGKFAGIFAALSLAIGAIGSVLISALAGFFELKWWQMPLALVGMVLCISLPSMVLAYLKLRKRDLAHVLDANGWAINAKVRINIMFGRTLTHLAKLPENAKVNLSDPFSKKSRPLIPILIVAVILLVVATYLLWYYGYLAKWGVWPLK